MMLEINIIYISYMFLFLTGPVFTMQNENTYKISQGHLAGVSCWLTSKNNPNSGFLVIRPPQSLQKMLVFSTLLFYYQETTPDRGRNSNIANMSLIWQLTSKSLFFYHNDFLILAPQKNNFYVLQGSNEQEFYVLMVEIAFFL